ncbi:hypothetical protein M441DRAFT_48217 [Trichoderma asperellum CBS 433.97]|uniref:FAD-binding domain-containing protein n=1 Tax=Trichoderma asperellum (strain ATCC 204424 / CBS 433.97 / NBRC 101777) TaxID=1042311 RepID=A0A2T3Z6D8_TRIA4|nr:hypothetical protein M441DRAFT_48217 [Trichoderma asperellum CBS 433.97]PTB40373.1 hypothetical protein M441DRAFT_48217 [Trichoderma asperellum CBS 433.97]
MTPLKVLISGNGVAGPALAYWLSLTGAKITLIERSRALRLGGQQIDIRTPQAIELVKRMGILERIRAAGVNELGMQLVDRNGRSTAFFPVAPKGSRAQSFTSEFEIMRGELVRILNGLTDNNRNVKRRFGVSMESFTQDSESNPQGKVHVKFDNGREEKFDLVVGADGIGSKTREAMLGPTYDVSDLRRQLGGYVGYFSVPSDPEKDEYKATFCHLPGSRVIGSRKDCDELLRVYILLRGENSALDAALKSGDQAQLKCAIAGLYQSDAWQCNRFLEALPAADDLYCTRIEQVWLPEGRWSQGRVALLGDAAYGYTASGYGCALSLAGAYFLAGEIATSYKENKSSPTAAVMKGATNYEKKFRPIAAASQNSSPWLDSMLYPRTKIGIWVLHRLAERWAKVASNLNLHQAAGKDWQLPCYELQKKKKKEVKRERSPLP